MAEPKFETVSFNVRLQGDYSRKFSMNRTFDGSRPFWQVKNSSGNPVGEGYSTDEALTSLARHLNVARDEIKKSAVTYECWKDSKLVYEIRVEGRVHQVYRSNGIPVQDAAYDTYKAARTYCVEKLS